MFSKACPLPTLNLELQSLGLLTMMDTNLKAPPRTQPLVPQCAQPMVSRKPHLSLMGLPPAPGTVKHGAAPAAAAGSSSPNSHG